MKNQRIKIMFAGTRWIDITNNRTAGYTAKELREYVNGKRLIVENEDCFADAPDFWYNIEREKNENNNS